MWEVKYDHDETFVQTLARNFKKPQTKDDRWIVVEMFGFIKFLASACTNHVSSGVLLATQAFTVKYDDATYLGVTMETRVV